MHLMRTKQFLCVDFRFKCVFNSSHSAATEHLQTEVSPAYKLPSPNPEEVRSCDMSASSSELRPRGLDHDDDEDASTHVVVQPEIAAQEEGGSRRSVGSCASTFN